MGQLRDRMEQDLILKGYSPATRRNYLLYARRLAIHYRRSPEELGEPEIRQFLLHLILIEQVAHATYRQVLASLRFLYTVTLDRPWEIQRVPFPRHQPKKLPEVLNRDQLLALFRALRKAKYRALLMTCYASGLRIGEACRLRPEDIDSTRKVIHIRAGKGSKERYTLLPQRLLEMLRRYWRLDRPQCWLFPGRTPDGHVSPDTVRQVFAKARREAGLGRWCTPHTLRHAFATHLLEAGTDLAVLQALMGHASVETTTIYTHVGLELLQKTPSLMDQLPPDIIDAAS
jgi:integrase/recombinase XerD